MLAFEFTRSAPVSDMDAVLEILRNTGPEYSKGFSNHGPMAAEAALKLGCGEKIEHWAQLYRKRLRPHPEAHKTIGKNDYKEALGDLQRVGDWSIFFRRQLSENAWQDVLKEWSAILAPGMMAGGTHGFIRTAHAVRSLSVCENSLRLEELSEGLAYWAAFYQLLPESDIAPSEHLLPSKAIEKIEPLTQEEHDQFKFKLIRESAEALAQKPDFAAVVNLIDPVDTDEFLSDLTSTFAGCYLANAISIGHCITFIHCLTAPSAIRLVRPFVDHDQVKLLLRYTWQAASALYAVFGQHGRGLGCKHYDGDWQEIIERAHRTGDEHAYKFTEACMREHAISPQPIFLAAAGHATRMIAKEPVSPELSRC